MVECDFEMQDFDCSRNQTCGVCCVESQSDHITAACMTKDPDRPDGHHASQSFNRVNGPADGPHPGWRDLRWPCRFLLHVTSKLPPHTEAHRFFKPCDCFHGFTMFDLPAPNQIFKKLLLNYLDKEIQCSWRVTQHFEIPCFIQPAI